MKTSKPWLPKPRAALFLAGLLASLSQPLLAATLTNWVAYHDHRPTDGVTSPNASAFDIRVTGDGGALKDFNTGAPLPVTVSVTSTGTADPDDFGGNAYPDPDTPSYDLFNGIVDVGNAGTIGVRDNMGSTVLLTFKNLDPTKKYTFAGTTVRGNNYADRWSVFTLGSVGGATAAHIDTGATKNLITKSSYPAATLTDLQVAMNSGENRQGSLVMWQNIDAGSDGTFTVLAAQYTGPRPFGEGSLGPYGYGFTAFYLAEVGEILPIAITTHPNSATNAPGSTATFSVATSGTGVTYQWQKANPGSTTFNNITGATSATYSPGAVSGGDDQAQYRVIVTGQGITLTSRSATLTVRGADIEIPGLLRMDIFRNLLGTSIDLLTSAPNYPNAPDETTAIAGFDTRTTLPTDALNNYGALITGFITVPSSGNYDIMLRSDDASQLYISTDDKAANLVLVAEETACCAPFEEPGLSGRTTATPIAFVAGRKYAVMALLKEGGGGDFLQVAWRKAGDTNAAVGLTPIPAAYVSGLFPAQGSINITKQPANTTAPQNATVTLSVEANSLRTPMLVQWQKNGVSVPGLVGASAQYGPLVPGDANAKFRAVISVPGATITSGEASLTLTTDTTPPSVTLTTASETFDSVTVDFSEAITGASAAAASNYSFDKGLAVSSVQVVSPRRVILKTSAQTPGTVYTLTIKNITDTAGLVSVANSSSTFSSFAVIKGGLKFEAWTNIGGVTVDLLTLSPNYLNPADVAGYLTAANTRTIYPDDTHENYGGRLSAWLVPTETASYDFMLRTDDAGQLWLSTDDKAANLALIAEETTCCGAFEEPGVSTRTTAAPIDLVAGRRYYFQVLYKEGGGGDYAQVAWRKVGDNTAASALTSMPGSLFEIVAQPGTLTPPTINFTSPASGAVIPVGTPIDVAVNASAGQGKVVTRVEIFRGSTRIADLNAGPYTVSVPDLLADVYTFSARVTDSAGLITTTTNITVSVGQAREVKNLVLMDDVTTWKYDRSGEDLGTAWRDAGFNDSAWPSGKALIADESGVTVVPIRTPISRLTDAGAYIKTFYFRTKFNWNGGTNDVKLSLRHVVDDGAVFYLNGLEFFRFGITGPVDATTDAASHEQIMEGPISVPASFLKAGENVFAVEVHQNGGSSSDVVFGAELTASVPAGNQPPKQAKLTASVVAGGVQIAWDAPGTLESSDNVNGPWTTVAGASASPLTVANPAGRKFYRVRH